MGKYLRPLLFVLAGVVFARRVRDLAAKVKVTIPEL